MELNEFNQNILLALEEPEIRDKITEIINTTMEAPQLHSYREEIKAMENQLDACKRELAGERLKNQELKENNHKLETQIMLSQEEYEKKYVQWKEFENFYHTLYSTYQMYQQISPAGRNAIKGIFKKDTPDVWIAAGTQPENISALWEYTRMQIMERRYQDVDKLAELIYYFIDLYNKTKNDPIYKLQPVSPGDEFDVEYHIRTSNSRAVGKIKKIVLYGFENVKTKAILKKSVIEI